MIVRTHDICSIYIYGLVLAKYMWHIYLYIYMVWYLLDLYILSLYVAYISQLKYVIGLQNAHQLGNLTLLIFFFHERYFSIYIPHVIYH